MAKGNGKKTANGSSLTQNPELMNLAVRSIDTNLGPRNADSFQADLHPDIKADFILANPSFNMSDRSGENLRKDVLNFRPISDHGNVNKILGKFGGAGQLRSAVNQFQSLLYAA